MFNTEAATDEAFERWKLGAEFEVCKGLSGDADDVSVDWTEWASGDEAPIVGDTDAIIDGLATLVDACGYEDLLLVPRFVVPGMRTEDRIEQLRALAEDVKPYFDDRSLA